MIIRPTKVYLDYALWVNLAEGRCEDRLFLSLVDCGAVVPLLSAIHLIEMDSAEAKAPDQHPGLVVARYFDRVLGTRRAKLLWVRAAEFIRREEIVREAVRCQAPPEANPLPDVEPFAGRLYEVLGEGASKPDRRSIESLSFVEMLDLAVKYTPVRKHLADRDAVLERRRDLREEREAHGKRKIDRTETIERWVKPELQGQLGIDIAVVAKRFEVDRCPLLALALAFHNGWNVANSKGKPSDLEDYVHLAGVAYADVAFVDAATHDALRRGGLPLERLPRRNGEFEDFLRRQSVDQRS